MAICFKCGLPQFDGAAGYAGPQCRCFWSGGQNRLTSPAIASCNCRGPQNGEPLCPCQMRGVVVKDGRYVMPERDLGPAPTTKNSIFGDKRPPIEVVEWPKL